MRLLETQRRMAAIVMLPLNSKWRLASRMPDGSGVAAESAAFIQPNRRLAPHERLEIYSRSYWFRIIDAVYDDFPGLRAVLGEKHFRALTLAYLAECPSRTFTLRNIGGNLSQWMATHSRYLGSNPSLALDMAALEWAEVQAFDGAANPPLEPSSGEWRSLGAASRLGLQPHLTLLQLRHPVDDIRIAVNRARNENEDDTLAAREARKAARPFLRSKPEPICLAVYRNGLKVSYRRLAQGESAFLSALRRGFTMGRAAVAAFDGSSIPASAQPGNLRHWVARAAEFGWLCTYQRTAR
jgi:hypothetical protein